MKLPQDRCYMTEKGGFENNKGCRVLNQLWFMDGCSGRPKRRELNNEDE